MKSMSVLLKTKQYLTIWAGLSILKTMKLNIMKHTKKGREPSESWDIEHNGIKVDNHYAGTMISTPRSSVLVILWKHRFHFRA